jgi:hypothetical protein
MVKVTGAPDIVLRAPHLEYIPCEERVGVIWDVINQPLGTKVYVDAVYYDVRSAGEIDRQSLVNGEKECGNCTWNVPAIESDMVGRVQPRQQHAGPIQELAP